MTEQIQSPSGRGRAQDDPVRDHEEAQCDDEAQTLTDLFDQLGRAAFKRALAHRDVGTPRSAVPKAGNG